MPEIVAEGIIDAGTLRDYLGVFTPLAVEGRIHFNDGGLTSRVTDPSASCMVNPGRLDRKGFESFSSPGAATIAIDFEYLTERIKPADKSELVHMAVDMETRKLEVEHGRASQSLRLIDPESVRSEPEKKDLEYANWVTVAADYLAEAVEICDLSSDFCTITADPDEHSFTLYSEGDDDESRVEFGDEDVIEGSVTERTSSKFSLEFLEELASPIPDAADVTLRFDQDWPLAVEWSDPDAPIEAEALLAPRVSTD